MGPPRPGVCRGGGGGGAPPARLSGQQAASTRASARPWACRARRDRGAGYLLCSAFRRPFPILGCLLCGDKAATGRPHRSTVSGSISGLPHGVAAELAAQGGDEAVGEGVLVPRGEAAVERPPDHGPGDAARPPP